MKAISLWQPWATLIAAGVKPYETRHWAPPAALIGQPIAIHAAKKIDKDAVELAEDIMYGQYQPGGYELAERLDAVMAYTPDDLFAPFGQAVMPIGCVVAIARLDAAYQLGAEVETPSGPMAKVVFARISNEAVVTDKIPIDGFGNYAPGRWAWHFSNPKPLEPPVAMRGRQGFFDLPQGWLVDG